MSDARSHAVSERRARFLEQPHSETDSAGNDPQKVMDLLNAINDAQALFITEADSELIFKTLLEALVEITESESGFFDAVFYGEEEAAFKQRLAAYDPEWNEKSKEMCRLLDDAVLKNFFLDNFGELVPMPSETVIVNDFSALAREKSLPERELPVSSFMGLPVFFDGRLVCIAGLANRKNGYDTAVAAFIEPLLSTCAGIVHAVQKEQAYMATVASLRKNWKTFKTVADFTYDWEYWTGPDGRFIYVSPSCKRITGYTQGDFMANPDLMSQIIHPEDLDRVSAQEAKADASGIRHVIEYRIIAKDGQERWISHICQPVYAQTDNGRLDKQRFMGKRGSNRDITEFKRLQEENLRGRHMEAIITLAGGVAHQFNNALVVITGYLELMQQRCSQNPVLESYAREMRAAAEKMGRLTDQLLAYAKGGKYEEHILSFSAFLGETVDILQHSLGEDIVIDADFPEAAVKVKIDPTQIQMVLSAILSNASEAMDGSGRIRITNCLKKTLANTSEMTPNQLSGPYLELSIMDTGRGMDKKTLNRIFEPFYTTKFYGRGLGMAAAIGIMENHGGAIHVASEPGRGTTVSICLPVIEAPAFEK